MCEKVFLRLLLVGLQRILEYVLEVTSTIRGSCGFSWCLGHDGSMRR